MLKHALLVAGFLLLVGAAQAESLYGLGRAPTEQEIAAWDIAVGPAGEELPAGAGDVARGSSLFAMHCAACHGASGHEGPDDRLVGGHGSLNSSAPKKTIGSFWPYATTVFDYIRRAMPFPAPGSLSNDDVYALTAYLLHKNAVVVENFVANRESLPAVVMPNRDGFVIDPRPETFDQALTAP